jgi:hypothetical protein
MKLMVRADDDELAKLLDGVVGAVEATSYEKHMLWQEYASEALRYRAGGPDHRLRYSWKEGLSGLGHGVGEIDGRPVVISLLVDIVGGHRILFWHATSVMVDYDLIGKWLDAVLPDRRNSDPMNFSNLFHGLPEKITIWCRAQTI